VDQLAQLCFGRDDEESDIAEGGLLPAGFQPTAAYSAASNGRKRLIIGRKGLLVEFRSPALMSSWSRGE
jgi:hypothetical protein